jgi:hypothetical protein
MKFLAYGAGSDANTSYMPVLSGAGILI